MSGLFLGYIGGAVAGGATILGALPVVLLKDFSSTIHSLLPPLRLDFFIGLLLLVTALLSQSSVQEQRWFLLIFFVFGILFFKAAKNFIETTLMKTIALEAKEEKTVYFIFLMMLKNFSEGLAAGSLMSLGNEAISHTLISVILLQNVFDGIATAAAFVTLGFTPATALGAVLATASIEFFAGLFGGFFSVEIAPLLPLILAFTGGAMMGATIEFMWAKLRESEILLRPSLVSSMIVLLIFII